MSGRLEYGARPILDAITMYVIFYRQAMDRAKLKQLREEKGWSQARAAAKLRISQPYLSLLESGERELTARLARRYEKAFGLSPSCLPLPPSLDTWGPVQPAVLAARLGALGYRPYVYLAGKTRPENPAAVLLWALSAANLEPRLVEALPWLLLRFDDIDVLWLIREAKLHDLQNRLGFVAALATEVAKRHPHFQSRASRLEELAASVEKSRLAREDTLCDDGMSARMRAWTSTSRSLLAAHWNLLTAWKAEQLAYDD